MPLWDKVKANLVEWYSVAADKTEELAKIGIRRYDKFGISRDIERQLTELGSFVYEAFGAGRRDFATDPQLQVLIERVKVLEQDLARKEQEIASIRSDYRQKASAKARSDGADGQPSPAASGSPESGESPPRHQDVRPDEGLHQDLPSGDLRSEENRPE